ncbi:unnamed protein product [Vitrella brassicaformis CCMP3155]|uniref:Uncharacterized protein n=1 Tax=Vitrella brassicaformis (strain CCMP3155) TaxID=1169540 RepID=A0A0G4G2Y9_VITBC|nr:unnamed protein product [Vitrella brassicaformis CCMP3155]|eukprot:CEM22089.1 unnamed protein product [Vitrella brassicaformis CCMP3155]
MHVYGCVGASLLSLCPPGVLVPPFSLSAAQVGMLGHEGIAGTAQPACASTGGTSGTLRGYSGRLAVLLRPIDTDMDGLFGSVGVVRYIHYMGQVHQLMGHTSAKSREMAVLRQGECLGASAALLTTIPSSSSRQAYGRPVCVDGWLW